MPVPEDPVTDSPMQSHAPLRKLHERGSVTITDPIRAAFPADILPAFLAARNRLAGAGYGGEVPRVFAVAASQVAALHGPEAALALGPAASRIAIKVRPRIATLFLQTAVVMARKLDLDDFARWQLTMLNLLGTAPDTVLPLLERMDMLMDRLGVDRLDAWIATGLRLSGNDKTRRLAFFRLELPEAQRLLEQHAGKETFQLLEQQLRFYHTALWGGVPPLREALPDGKMNVTRRSSFASGLITMPSSFEGHRGAEAQVYRAALAHLGAHFAYGGPLFEVGQLKPMQIAVISLIEDARVETLAMREMPGLGRLWCQFHDIGPDGAATAPSLFTRLSRALIDPGFPIRHGWIEKGVRMFHDHMHQIESPALSRHIGNLLGNDLGQTRVQFNARDYIVYPVYRDDNLGLWDLEEDPHEPPPDQVEFDTDDPHQSEETRTPQDRKQSQPADEEPEPESESIEASSPVDGLCVMTLPEYDHDARIERSDWVTVNQYEPKLGDPRFWQRLEERHGTLLARTEAMIRGATVGRARRLKRQVEGEALDVDACIEAAIDLRSGRTPEHRVYERISPPDRSIAVHLLLDMSQSTVDRIGAQTVLSIEQDAAAILAKAMDQLGDPLAITAFASAGREDLRTISIKRFMDDLGMMTGMALSGLQAGYSTRIGAGLRMAGVPLALVPCHRRLVLLITDGEPSDIDVPNPSYLVADAKRAVQALSAQGIDVFCIALGKAAGQRKAEIFGRNGFIQIDRLDTLPEKLTAVYLRMTR